MAILIMWLWYTVPGGYAALFLHEMGHTIAGELLGVPVKGLKFTWFGIGVVRAPGGPLSNLLISAAGPIFSLLVGLVTWPLWKLFATANFCMFLFNLIPIANSDGDRVWRCAAELGWIDDPTLPRPGLAKSHSWLKSKGFSTWDLEQMELSEKHPPAPGVSSLQKMESGDPPKP